MVCAVMAWLLAAVAVIAPRAEERMAAEVICAEAGPGKRDEDMVRARRVAAVIDNRVRRERETHPRLTRQEAIVRVLTAPNQWSRRCKVAFEALPGSMRVLSRHLVEQRLHWSAPPDWLTRDVLWVIAEREAVRIGKRWRRACLVRVEFGQAFYRECAP